MHTSVITFQFAESAARSSWVSRQPRHERKKRLTELPLEVEQGALHHSVVRELREEHDHADLAEQRRAPRVSTLQVKPMSTVPDPGVSERMIESVVT